MGARLRRVRAGQRDLAGAFVAALPKVFPGHHSVAGYVGLGVTALAGVWALNFLLVLPLLNPRFVTLMPYAATLVFKALFGLAMGAVLARAGVPGRAV